MATDFSQDNDNGENSNAFAKAMQLSKDLGKSATFMLSPKSQNRGEIVLNQQQPQKKEDTRSKFGFKGGNSSNNSG